MQEKEILSRPESTYGTFASELPHCGTWISRDGSPLQKELVVK